MRLDHRRVSFNFHVSRVPCAAINGPAATVTGAGKLLEPSDMVGRRLHSYGFYNYRIRRAFALISAVADFIEIDSHTREFILRLVPEDYIADFRDLIKWC